MALISLIVIGYGLMVTWFWSIELVNIFAYIKLPWSALTYLMNCFLEKQQGAE